MNISAIELMFRRRFVLPSFFGVFASLFLLGFYLMVMGIGSGSWDFTLSELWRLRFWVSALVAGFGIQVGLYSYLKSCARSGGVESGSATLGGTTSAIAMVACCAHHLTDILPLLGLAVAATFLVKYQLWFLALGIASNIIGIFIMLRQFKHLKR